ncbi:MAG: glutamine synthetase [Deltaproteobacteria bacterium]|nr:MAG: glutamine synthetase [Deltaproteobacteria bacterium]
MKLETLKKRFEEDGVRRVKIGGFDIDGVLRGKYVSLEKFLSAAEKGLGFCDVVFGWDIGDILYDNVKLTGWHTGYPDLHATVDLSTYRLIPWEPETAAFLLRLHPEVGPRSVLERVEKKAEAMGFRVLTGAEFEFFLFKETPDTLAAGGIASPQPMDPGMFGYSWLRSSQASALMHDLLDGCEAFDVPMEGLHTETGPGVYEAAMKARTLVAAADHAALFKTAVKEIASRHGVTASFMAKWSLAYPGCSGHLHQSLWDAAGKKNLFHDPDDPRGMSKLFRHYLAGQQRLLPELTACIAPTVNSYKRFVEGTWAPLNATWGIENRTCALRVITGPGKNATRVEVRATGADINPYVAYAATVGAGLYGIEQGLEPTEPVTGNAYEAKGAKARPLPRSLKDAVSALKRSRAAREILGEDFVDHYVRTREWEVRAFEGAVTDWELKRYFELV